MTPFTGWHESVVQALLSLGSTELAPTQLPPLQASAWVQTSLSVQASPSGLLGLLHKPVVVLHTPTSRQSFNAVQTTVAVVSTQAPSTQLFTPLQASASLLHEVPLATLVWLTPVTGWQASAVQGLPSSKATGVPTQLPPEQISPVVQTVLSVQESVLFVYTVLPFAGLQVSSVQGLLSVVGVTGFAPTQAPLPLQLSVWVHASPSLHVAPFAA
jgi:hypothetical protein